MAPGREIVTLVEDGRDRPAEVRDGIQVNSARAVHQDPHGGPGTLHVPDLEAGRLNCWLDRDGDLVFGAHLTSSRSRSLIQKRGHPCTQDSPRPTSPPGDTEYYSRRRPRCTWPLALRAPILVGAVLEPPPPAAKPGPIPLRLDRPVLGATLLDVVCRNELAQERPPNHRRPRSLPGRPSRPVAREIGAILAARAGHKGGLCAYGNPRVISSGSRPRRGRSCQSPSRPGCTEGGSPSGPGSATPSF